MSLRFDRKGSLRMKKRGASFSVRDYLDLDKPSTSTGRSLDPVQEKSYFVPGFRNSVSVPNSSMNCHIPGISKPSVLGGNNSNSNGSGGGSGGVLGGGSVKRSQSLAGRCRRSFASISSNSSSTGKNNSNSNEDLDDNCSLYSGISGRHSSLSNYSYGFHWLPDMDCNRPVDPFRFSQATLEDTQEDELNAILGELSALQLSLDREIINGKGPPPPPPTHHHPPPNLLQSQSQPTEQSSQPLMNGNGNAKPNSDGARTESPDDSGFSDNASLLSSGSSFSASGSSGGSSTTSSNPTQQHKNATVINANEFAAVVSARLGINQNLITDEKAEKIRIALAKMRAASITRLYVKAFSPDGSSKALMVEEGMTSGRVLSLLADKNHVPLSPKWSLVESIPHLHMERIYEDHEMCVENLLCWTRDSKNKIYFVEREEKYDMFVNPQKYFLENRVNHNLITGLDDHTKIGLIEDFFGHGVGVPEVESILYLKAEGKKAWKKFPFVLRASGIYYYPKGKNHANSSKDLVCLATIDDNQQTYLGVGWKKKFKAPTEFGFILKPPRLQVKSPRHMKYLCAENQETLNLWISGLRLAKYGKQLWENYRLLIEDLAQEDLDRFGRSVSLASMPIQIATHNGIQIQNQIANNTLQQSSNQENSDGLNLKLNSVLQRQFSSASESSQSQVPIHCNKSNNNSHNDNSIEHSQNFQSPCKEEFGFENENQSTIKRKPTSVKMPLTLKTRSIVGDYINTYVHEGNNNAMPLNHHHTLGRKRSGSGNSLSSSNSSSSSSISSQITIQNQSISNHIQMQQQHQHQQQMQQSPNLNTNSRGKPPFGPPPANRKPGLSGTQQSQQIQMQINLQLQSPAPTPSVPEEDNNEILDFENLPPPPPELLSDTPDSSLCMEMPIPPPMHILGHPPIPNPPQMPFVGSSPNNSLNNRGPPPPPLKKGVSFASELTERLGNNNNINNRTIINPQLQSQSHPHQQMQMQPQLSSPVNKLEDPMEFLADLQRVMEKKWQVAKKCSIDPSTTPHEVLGFRFDPSVNGAQKTPENNLNNVRAWVSQHYGSNSDEPPPLLNNKPPNAIMGNQVILPLQQGNNSLPRNKSPHPHINSQNIPQSHPQPQHINHSSLPRENNGPPPLGMTVTMAPIPVGPINNYSPLNKGPPPPTPARIESSDQGTRGELIIYENFQQERNRNNQQNLPNNNVMLRSKKPPPPLPKRSDKTHLSAHLVFN